MQSTKEGIDFTDDMKALDESCAAELESDELLQNLRRRFPHGHPRFNEILRDLAQLHSDKNHDYAMGGDVFGNFNRVAAILALYPDFPVASPEGVAIVYALKQIDAILWGMSQRITHKVEGSAPRAADAAVYFLLIKLMSEDKKNDFFSGHP